MVLPFVLDAHFDILGDVAYRRSRGEHKVIEKRYLPGLRKGGVTAIVASLFVDDQYVPEMALRCALMQISALLAEIHESSHCLALCTNAQDFREAADKGKIGFMLSFEGAEPLTDAEQLYVFEKLGVRGLGLAWSRRNLAADGCDFAHDRKKGGLTSLGEDLVRQATDLGMFIDVSHLSDEGVADVLKVPSAKVVASHSDSRECNPIPRNLPDELLKEIAGRGGMVGLNSCSVLVGMKNDIPSLLAHLDHMVAVMGEDHVGLGLDICDSFFKSNVFTPIGEGLMPFDIVQGHESIPLLARIVMEHGYTFGQWSKFAGNNWLATYERFGLK